MAAVEFTGRTDTTGMRDDADLVDHIACISCDALGLVGWVQATLQLHIMSGDAGRAGVLVALQGLDAAERKHEATRIVDEVGAHTQRPGDVLGGDQLA